MHVTLTGGTGLIGGRLVEALQARGDRVTLLARDPLRARATPGVEVVGWDPHDGAAPLEGLAGRDGVIHLAGEPIAQRWNSEAKHRIRRSRVVGTSRLVDGLRQAEPRPAVLVSASATGYYGPHGDEVLDEASPAGRDFLAGVCRDWERAADPAQELGVRVVNVRTGVVLGPAGGALAKMLPVFRYGVGGPVAGGRQYLSWIAIDDLVRLYLAALDERTWSGPVNATAPEPVTNREFSHALGRVLHRPAVLPVPALALKALYGEMASIVTTGQRVVPKRALALGFTFRFDDVEKALRAVAGSG